MSSNSRSWRSTKVQPRRFAWHRAFAPRLVSEHFRRRDGKPRSLLDGGIRYLGKPRQLFSNDAGECVPRSVCLL